MDSGLNTNGHDWVRYWPGHSPPPPPPPLAKHGNRDTEPFPAETPLRDWLSLTWDSGQQTVGPDARGYPLRQTPHVPTECLLTDGYSDVGPSRGPSGPGFGARRFLASIRFMRCRTRWLARSIGNLSVLVRRARMHIGPVALCNMASHSRASRNTRTTISSRVNWRPRGSNQITGCCCSKQSRIIS